MVTINVHYHDHQTGHFHPDPERGWKIDAALRMLIIKDEGHNRRMIPLENIQVIEVIVDG